MTASTHSHQSITVLGSTGSIGMSTLDVISQHPQRFSVFALTANTQVERMLAQCLVHSPQYAVMVDEPAAVVLAESLKEAGSTTEVLTGGDALQAVAAHDQVDTVMAAIVGGVGLLPTMSAVRAGKKVLLANKESLVMAGRLFMDAVAASGAQLLPIDSEHNAIFQCLPDQYERSIRKVLLTGSGGPFRTWSGVDIQNASPEQACRHPNWSMGKKISVDSASLMNKGLEFIEAKWLFDLTPDMIEVVIHPQSIIHSMVEYIDGSILAQLGHPDMRTPIAHGLAYPSRIESGVPSLDIIAAARLDFEAPNYDDFPALSLAITAAATNNSAAAVLNAANEIAVDAFLNHQITFGQISDVLKEVMDGAECSMFDSIDEILEIDTSARSTARQVIEVLCR